MHHLHRLVRHVVPWVLAVVVFVLSWAAAEGFQGVPSPWGTSVTLVIAALSGLATGLMHWRRWPLSVIAAVGWITLALYPAAFVTSYLAGSDARSRREILRFLLGSLAILVISLPVSWSIGGAREMAVATFPNAALFYGLIVGLPFVVGLWMNTRRTLFDEQVRRTERERIAREMHDVLAHRVSLMVLHAGALEVNTTDERVATAAGLVRRTGREALTELRQVLGMLRSPGTAPDQDRRPLPLLRDLDELLDQSRALGISVTRHDLGEPRSLSPATERTAYRVVQEALTNVHKHAGDSPTDVSLRFHDTALEVVVENDAPKTPPPPMPHGGFGLAGLRERVELLGGDFRAGPRPSGGFVVQVRIPQ
ncbi:MAG TPA: histidine kinase [Actinopolymorphaceae bacterium]